MNKRDEIYSLISSLNDRTSKIKDILTSVNKGKKCMTDAIDSLMLEEDSLKKVVYDLDAYDKSLEQELSNAKRLEQRFIHVQEKLGICENALPDSICSKAEANSGAKEAVVPTTTHKLKKPQASIPLVSKIADEMLTPIPGYMKGRLTAVQINDFIMKFNNTIQNKYQLLKKPKKSLNSNEKKKILVFREQATPVTKGVHFCTLEDLKEVANLNFTNSVRSIIMILRHLNLIHELREARQPVKYSVVEQ